MSRCREVFRGAMDVVEQSVLLSDAVVCSIPISRRVERLVFLWRMRKRIMVDGRDMQVAFCWSVIRVV